MKIIKVETLVLIEHIDILYFVHILNWNISGYFKYDSFSKLCSAFRLVLKNGHCLPLVVKNVS